MAVAGGAAREHSFLRSLLRRLLSIGAIGPWRTTKILIIFSVLCCSAFGQEPSQAPERSKPAEQNRPEEKANQGQGKTPEQPTPSVAEQAANAAMKPVELFSLLERKSIVFPDIAASTAALSPGQKFELFLDNSIAVSSGVAATFGSLIGQAEDSPTGFGVSGTAYTKRLGSALARESSGNFFGVFVLASALHDDPRFFPERNPTLKQSVKYSFRSLFVSRNDQGQRVANLPGLLGPLLGEGLANVYWPDRNRTVGDTLFRYGLDLAVRSAGNMFREYWPVISAKVRHDSERSIPH